MNIVIDIPEDVIKDAKSSPNYYPAYHFEKIWKAIVNGTSLPKGHGDLIDKSKIYKAIPAEEDNCTGMGMTYDEMYAYNDGIDAMYNLLQDAKPIIEADKAESEVHDAERRE